MTIYFENETEKNFDFSYEEVAKLVIRKGLELHNCEYDFSVSIYVVGEEEIKETNFKQRGINKVTDVLSFPNIPFEKEGDFSVIDPEMDYYEYFDPDSDELILGEIMLCYEKIASQAKEYGHSAKREYAFLIAHSILHLIGYDHMEEDERQRMETMQRNILDELKITREG